MDDVVFSDYISFGCYLGDVEEDNLGGLKENVIVGHKIPAGTGLREYNDVIVGSKDEYTSLLINKEEEKEEKYEI